MGSTFGSLALFDSGPHRFVEGSMGRLTLPPLSGANGLPHTQDYGERELVIFQSGRLVAPDDAALWAQVDAIRAEAESTNARTLTDHHGRSWAGVELIRFSPGERIDRGRRVSLAYTAVYLRF